MKANNLNISHYNYLRTIEKNIEDEIEKKNKKLLTAISKFDYNYTCDELIELKQTLVDISRTVISYSSTFEIQ